MYTKEQIETAVKNKGYVWFDSDKDYDVNIVGVRNETAGDDVTNLFDDTITVSYKLKGKWMFHEWTITTDPGKKAMLQYSNPAGVARLVEGQYRGSHHIDLHQGKYKALKQFKPVKVYRDADKDMEFDENKIQEGLFGINIHRASINGVTKYVENWSEGCQVFANINDFNQFMKICENAAKIHGNSFTYTLIKSSDIL